MRPYSTIYCDADAAAAAGDAIAAAGDAVNCQTLIFFFLQIEKYIEINNAEKYCGKL